MCTSTQLNYIFGRARIVSFTYHHKSDMHIVVNIHGEASFHVCTDKPKVKYPATLTHRYNR